MEITQQVERVAEQFAALAAAPRIKIIRLLLAAFRLGGMTAGQIQAELGMPGSTLNYHLGKLESAGLIESRRDRQWIWYSAKADGLRQLLNFLFEECCTRSEIISLEELTTGRKR